mgnify:FL=1
MYYDTAADEEAARKQLKTVTEKWLGQYPSAMNRWHDNWDAIEIKNVIANVYIRTKE